MPARSVAEWARAAPAARDAVLALAEQAVGLQPAAEAVIQWHRLDGEVAPGDAEEGELVGLRDLLRRTATVRGRLVADVPGL